MVHQYNKRHWIPTSTNENRLNRIAQIQYSMGKNTSCTYITTTSLPPPMLEQIDALLCIITSCFPQLSTLRVTQYEHPHPYVYKYRYSPYHRMRGLRVRPFSITPHVDSCTLSSEDHHRLTMYNILCSCRGTQKSDNSFQDENMFEILIILTFSLYVNFSPNDCYSSIQKKKRGDQYVRVKSESCSTTALAGTGYSSRLFRSQTVLTKINNNNNKCFV